MDKEGVVTAIKNFILPELKEIKDNQAKIGIRLDPVEKSLSDINGHLIDQSRRIDEVRTELTGRIDATNKDLVEKTDGKVLWG
ncbi:MAG: hypothetical protein KCCBMMGE_00959 [Candidatus Methanoperedenaceae archaeon GB37]|nr:MAG: hypothetical protein KCCBMMGE_00959 [Candidatus Methanoperedenaceae archaeon GB37]